LLSPGASPDEGETAIYDSQRDRVVTYAGQTAPTAVRSYSLSPTFSVQGITTTGPQPPIRYNHTAIYDPVGDAMIVYGGQFGAVLYGDCWKLQFTGPNTGTWSQISAPGTPPGARTGHSAIYDPLYHRMLVLAGENDTNQYFLIKTYALSLTGTPTWTLIYAYGIAPSIRDEQTAIYDAVNARIIVWAGEPGPGYNPDVPRQVWALWINRTNPSVLSWGGVTPAGPPSVPVPDKHTAVYDPIGQRMLGFGGQDQNGAGTLNQTWSLTLPTDLLSLGQWSLIQPSGDPGLLAIDPTADLESSSQAKAGPSAFAFTASPQAGGDVQFQLSLSEPGEVHLEVFDVAGRRMHAEIESMVSPGSHRMRWDGRDEVGRRVSSGIYFARVSAPGHAATRRIALLAR
jgi:hypothetical protein